MSKLSAIAWPRSTSLLLVLLLKILHVGQVNGQSLSLAPWYCPPTGEFDANCVPRSSNPPPYIEESLVPLSVRVLATIGSELEEDLGGDATVLMAASQALLTLVEAVRLLMCMARFHSCVQLLGTVKRVFDEVCAIIDLNQLLLRPFAQGQQDFGDEDVCWALFVHGKYQPLMRAVTQPLQGLAVATFPWMELPPPANFGTRFFYEHFFEARSLRQRQRRNETTMTRKRGGGAGRKSSGGSGAGGGRGGGGGGGEASSQFPRDQKHQNENGERLTIPRTQALQRLEYPSIFSPNAVCHGRSQASQFQRKSANTLFVGDVQEALARLQRRGIALSNFVVNFGAADGECGSYEDWNADPANCLVMEGAAGLLVEGNPELRQLLLNKFGERSDVVLSLEYLSLSNVSTMLRRHIEQTPAFSYSPDLLKVDLDHSDCLFTEEAVSTIHPKLLHVEYASRVPPPMDYVQHYQDELLSVSLRERQISSLEDDDRLQSSDEEAAASSTKPASTHGLELTGCSLSAFLTRLPWYSLVAAGPEDLLMVRNDLQPALEIGPAPDPWESWLDGAFCQPLHLCYPGYIWWGFDFRILADKNIDLPQRQAMLEKLLQQHGSTAFTLAAID